MQELKEVIERLEPPTEERGDWDEVARRAGVRRRATITRLVTGVAMAAAAIFALVLFEPWDSENPTLLERALAAVDDGPVLHVVLRGEWGGTLVNLESGQRTPVHGENEIWYDPTRPLIHEIQRLGETVQHENVYDPGRVRPELVALGGNYQAALRSGTARIAGEEVLDGERVTWIIVRRELLPDTDGKRHEWTQQVAVSNETFRPVATRDARDRRPPPGAVQRVIELEMLPAGEGDFTAGEGPNLDGGPIQQGRDPIALEAAAGVLGHTPLWLGQEHEGIPLAQVSETFLRQGRTTETPLTGPAAEDAKACARATTRTGTRLGVPACERVRARGQGFHIRGANVYELGPVEWGEKQRGVVFFYGTVGDDPSTYHRDLVPLGKEPNVAITESTWLPSHVPGGSYIPPEGSVFISVGGRHATLRSDGLYIVILASSEELILSTARALKPMQR